MYFNEALVEISIHLLKSGSPPFFIPSNYLLISVIISFAALPTAAIVRAENAYGIIEPTINPAKVTGSSTFTV